MMAQDSQPFFVCLDTAHWVGLTHDIASSQRRALALQRVADLTSVNAVLVLTQHHLLELIQHGNTEVARSRVESLRLLPVLTTVQSEYLPHLGSVVDLLAQEILVGLQFPALSASEVAGSVKLDLFARVTGESIGDAVLEQFDEYRRRAQEQQKRHRELAIIGQSRALDQSEEAFLRDGLLRSSDAIDSHLDCLQERFTVEVTRRKDPRMPDASQVAEVFVNSLRSIKAETLSANDPIGLILREAGLSRSDVEDCRTLGDVRDVVIFMHRARAAYRALGLSPEYLRRLPRTQIPSFLIQRGLIRHRAEASTVSGSDVSDSHLLSWAPYVDSLFVDKRTLENVRRMVTKRDESAQFLGKVSRASTWSVALDQVEARIAAESQVFSTP